MVFAGPAEAAAVSGIAGSADRVRRIAIEHGGLEGVNDNPNTAPSKRLLRLWPTYVKTSDGPAILRRIGLQSIRNECPHLHRWLTTLEQM